MNVDDDDSMEFDPEVIDAPEVIWLQYGELEHDDTHSNLYKDGDVSWCTEQVFGCDVKYVRADISRAAYRAGQEDMRERCLREIEECYGRKGIGVQKIRALEIKVEGEL